jgi:aspartyl-tRNA synthetase
VPFNKWTLEVCTGYTSDTSDTLEEILELLTEDSATPYFHHRLVEMTYNEAKTQFGVPDEHLRYYYEICDSCEQGYDGKLAVYPDEAMLAVFERWNVRADNFSFCSESCRLEHFLEQYRRKGSAYDLK